MKEDDIVNQAAEMERMWPQIARRFFTLAPDDPAAELPVAQLRVCTILQGGSTSMTAIADELGISMSAVTQIADRLERHGLVERHAETDDRRTKTLALTDHGSQVMQTRWTRRVERITCVLRGLPAERRQDVMLVLRDLLAVTDVLLRSESVLPAPVDLVVR